MNDNKDYEKETTTLINIGAVVMAAAISGAAGVLIGANLSPETDAKSVPTAVYSTEAEKSKKPYDIEVSTLTGTAITVLDDNVTGMRARTISDNTGIEMRMSKCIRAPRLSSPHRTDIECFEIPEYVLENPGTYTVEVIDSDCNVADKRIYISGGRAK